MWVLGVDGVGFGLILELVAAVGLLVLFFVNVLGVVLACCRRILA